MSRLSENKGVGMSKLSVYPVCRYGLPATIENDNSIGGGDSASMLGIIISLCDESELTKWVPLLPYLINERGLPVRTPMVEQPAGRDNRFSRDQMIGVICAGIRLGKHPTVDKLFEAHKKRWFLRAWNYERNGDGTLPHPGGPDLTGPQVWGLWIRYKKPRWGKYVLWFCDLENLIGARRWVRAVNTETPKEALKNRITCNHMSVAMTAYEYMPTWVSKRAYKLTPFLALISRWEDHNISVQSYQTAGYYRVKFTQLLTKDAQGMFKGCMS